MKRRDKINYYLDIAEAVSERSTCLRKRWGTVIVNHDEIIATGYNGAPRGRKNCSELGYCRKKKIFPDTRHAGYDACRGVHSEQNALVSAARRDMIDADLYLVAIRCDTNDYEEGPNSCMLCRKLIINSGIRRVFIRIHQDEYRMIDVEKDWIVEDESLTDQVAY